MSISIKVRYSRQEQAAEVQSYLLKVEVIEAVGMPTKIFVFQRRVKSSTDPQAAALSDIFISLADPVDFEDIADPLNDMPYYRLDSVTLRFRSMTELEEVKDLIDQDIQKLVDSLKAEERVIEMEEKTYG
jgi:hypothetical protein